MSLIARVLVPLTLLLSGAVRADSATLTYRAFVAGVAIGEATVEVVVTGGRYRVDGDARSNGWMKGFTHWRNRFHARGRVDGRHRMPAEFAYTESDHDKHRHVQVRNGVLEVRKNGELRTRHASPGGFDLVTALFVQPRCSDTEVLHTGRHVYHLSRVTRQPEACRYVVTDDDDESFEVEVDLARRGDLVVPERITVHGWVPGRVELVDAS